MLAFTKTIARGNNDPMTKEQAAKIYIPIDGFIRKIKQGKIAIHEMLEVYQHFLLISGACDIALHKTKESAKSLIVGRDKKLLQAVKVSKDVYKALKGVDTIVLRGTDYITLDEGFTASVELLETLPDWCFMESRYQMMKMNKGLRK